MVYILLFRIAMGEMEDIGYKGHLKHTKDMLDMATQLNSRAFWQTESGRQIIGPATSVKIYETKWIEFNHATSCRKLEKTTSGRQHLLSTLY